MQRINSSEIAHFKVRLAPLYARLSQNPWRKTVLYFGRPEFIPLNYDKKFFFEALIGSVQEQTSLKKTFKIYLDGGELPFSDQSVDIIIIQLDEIPAQLHRVLMQEFHRILIPQGKLFVTIYNRFSLYFRNIGHDIDGYNPITIRQILQEFDFLVSKTYSHSFLIQSQIPVIKKFFIDHEKFLCKFFNYFSNLYTVVAIKKSNSDDFLPSYLKLSKKIPLPSA